MGLKPMVRALLCAFSLLLMCLAYPKTTIRMVVWDGQEATTVIRKALKDFETANPDITVKLEQADYQVYFQKLLAQYAADTAPDIAMLDPGSFQRYSTRGALLPLNDFFPKTPGFDISSYYKPIVDAHSAEGKLYVLPRDIAPMGIIYYNKKLFQEAGIATPDGSWTWSFEPRPELGDKDFLTVLKKLTKKDKNGKVSQWAYSAWDLSGIADLLTYSSGGRYVDNREAFDKVNFDDPRVIRAYDFVDQLANKFHYMPSQSELTSVVQATAVDLFNMQRVAMFQCGIWSVPIVRKANVPGSPNFFEWDIVEAPGFQDPETGEITRAASTGGSGYGILSSTRNPDAAWKVVEWMAGAEGMRAMAEAGLAQPAIKEIATSSAWIPNESTPIEQQYPWNRIATHNAVDHVIFSPSAPYWGELNGIVGAKLTLIYDGTQKAKDVLPEVNQTANDRLKDILAQQKQEPFNWLGGAAFAVLLCISLTYWVFKPDLGKKLTHRQKAEARAGFLFALPWLIGLVVFTLGPMMISLLMSTTDWDYITSAKFRGPDNFTEALSRDPRFWKSLQVTLVYTVVSVPLGIISALGLALVLNTRVKGVPIYRTCFYLPSLASAVAGALIWRRVFQSDGGLLNMALFGPDGTWRLPLVSQLLGPNGELPNWLGSEHLALPALIMMSAWGVGAGMVILLAGLQAIPEFYYEAAKLDGASPVQTFRVITLPLLSPALLFTLITGAIGSFQSFTNAYIMTQGGPNDATRFYMLHLYDAAFTNLRMGYAAALAWILFAIIFVVSLLQLRLNKKVYYEGGER